MRSWSFTVGLVVSLATLLTAQTAQSAPWTDDPLLPRVTVVKVVHITELRTRINAVRDTCELAAVTWTDSTLTATETVIKAVHVSELRTALNAAFTGCERTVPTYTDPTLTVGSTVVKVVHIAELRAAVVDLEGQYRSPVDLGSAGNFAILTKAGITDVPTSAIVGDVGSSPITGAAILVTCTEVTGTIYSVDAAGPAPCVVTNPTLLGVAVLDMGTAYEDAKGRVGPDFTELGAGEIGGLTLAPGLYKWGTGVSISTDVTLFGGPNAVWIFQVGETLDLANGTRVNLSGGALPKNIFWQVAGKVTLGTTAHFEGVILGQTMIAVNTGASVNGRLFAHTEVTLQMNTVTEPAP